MTSSARASATISASPDSSDLYVADPALELRGARRPLRPWAQLLEGQRLLVTGAGGFIGGHLLRRLGDLGCDAVGTVLRPEEAAILRDRGYEAEVLDLADDEPWDHLLEGVDVVFHLAACFQEVHLSEDIYDLVNHRAALKLVRTAARTGVRRFVHCSTVGVHGNVKEIPATEETPFNPMDVYHRTKLRGELAVLEFARGLPPDGMVVTVNRPAMVYGPGDRRMLKLFRAILSRRFVMIGSGNVLAHLGFIQDQTESFLLCATAPRENVHLQSFNIASGRPLTLNRLAELIASAGDVRVPRLHLPVAPVWLAAWLCEMICRAFGATPPLFRRRVGFFTHNRAFDLSKARKLLDYESRWPHREGIEETIRWYREAGWL